MEVRRDPRSFIFFIILLLLINSPEPRGQQGFDVRSRYDEVLQHERDELDVLNRTRYGDLDPNKNKWLNITGLNEEDGFVWELLAPVQRRAAEQTRNLLGASADGYLDGASEEKAPVYRNITGYVQGEWARSSLSRVRHPSDINSTTIFEHIHPAEFDRNITGTGGMVRLRISEKEQATYENRTVSEVSATMVIGDHDSTGRNWWEFTLHGVHFPHLGGVVLTTTSDKFGGIFALPHFQLSQYLYAKAQKLFNQTIGETIDWQADRIYPAWNPWSSAGENAEEMLNANPPCEFVVYLQGHPIQFQSNPGDKAAEYASNIDWLEHELRYPTGAPIPRQWPLTMSMVGFSPDCGFVFESKGPPDFSPSEYGHLVGAKTEVYNGRVRHAILALAIALFLQLGFLIKQMKDTASPSTRNRVSFYAVAMCCIGDGLGFLAFVFLPHYVGAAELVFYAVSFLFCFSAFLELRFLMEIWTVQATERMRQDRERAANSPPATTRPSGTPVPAQSSPPMPETGGLPLPVTAARPAAPTPVIIAPDQDDPDEATTPPPAGNTTATAPSRADYGALYSRYCFLLFVLFFVTLQFLTVRATVRAFYFNTLCFVYLSFWCPQIYRNVMRNCRKALRWDFVLGQSAARMLPIIYFYAVPDNILFSRNDMRALLVLAGWVWVQIVALASQELLGPRFFIREGWAPPAYDYHPILREDEEGATMPIGSSQSADDDDSASMSKAGEAKHKGKKVFDCSICATDIEVSVIPSGESSENAPGLSGMILQRRAYMVTPCRHIFHTPCLEGWMRYRLQCPNCREILPPL